MNKKGLQFSFTWLFAVIIGAIIIFLAIYAAVKIGETESDKINTVMAKKIDIIFEPMKTGLEAGSSDVISLTENAIIYNDCSNSGEFGRQTFYVSSDIGIGERERGEGIPVRNKYVFSNDTIKGDRLYILSHPFKLGFPSKFYGQQLWKVGNLITVTTNRYCLKNAPYSIEDEVRGLPNIEVENCSAISKTICFGDRNCDITITSSDEEYKQGMVMKNGKSVYYIGNLIYPAIFSSKEIYECNVNRLMKRAVQQASLYKDQSRFLEGRDKCSSLPVTGLTQFVNVASSYEDSSQLINIKTIAKEIKEQNSAAQCQLW